MKGWRSGRGRWIAVAGLLGAVVGLRTGTAQTTETTAQKGQASTQKTETPELEEILQRLESNLSQYDSGVPSFFCDEHVVSRMVPDVHDQETVTDSVFRLKRVVNADHTTTLEESREVKTVNGRPATTQEIGGPSIVRGAFEGGLAVVSLSQQSCMNYTLERAKRNDAKAPIVIRFVSVLTAENKGGCLLQENGRGQVYIDRATMQITRMELTTPHHTIIPGDEMGYGAIVGEWALSVDYAPVVLDGKSFWMPATITSRTASGRGTFHPIVWTFKASYRNFHKLEVRSRIVPFGEATAQ
jgi:hypothetical protein